MVDSAVAVVASLVLDPVVVVVVVQRPAPLVVVPAGSSSMMHVPMRCDRRLHERRHRQSEAIVPCYCWW